MHIHRKIERFLRNHDYPPTKFGRAVARDPRLVNDMRKGREIGASLSARAEAFMADFDSGQGLRERSQ